MGCIPSFGESNIDTDFLAQNKYFGIRFQDELHYQFNKWIIKQKVQINLNELIE